jgi:Tol biopolymer transport system component
MRRSPRSPLDLASARFRGTQRALLALVICSLLALAPPASAVVPGANGRILFTRLNCVPTTGAEVRAQVPGCQSQSMVVATPNDADETVLVTDPSDTIFATRLANWSPDGRTVIFARNTCRSNAPAGASAIWTINPDGAGLAQLVQAPSDSCFGEGPVYTRDGTRIVVELCCIEGHGDSLWIMNTDGSGLQPLTSEPDGVDDEVPQVSPDGTRIAFSECSDRCRIATVGINGGSVQVFDYPTGGLASPNWSTDSKKIAFNFGANGCTSDVATINADGTDLTQLTFAPPCGLHPTAGNGLASYSPDGTKIIFSHSFNTPGVDVGFTDLFTMNPDGTGMAQVTYTPAPELNAEWAPRPLPTLALGKPAISSSLAGTAFDGG